MEKAQTKTCQPVPKTQKEKRPRLAKPISEKNTESKQAHPKISKTTGLYTMG